MGRSHSSSHRLCRGCLTLLIDQVETVMLEAEQRSIDSHRSQSAQPCKHSRTQRQKRSRYLLPLKLGVGALLITLGTYHFLAVTTQANRTTKTTIVLEIAPEVAANQQLEKSELLDREAMEQIKLAQESKNLARYKAAIIRWEQASDLLREIPSTSPASSQAQMKLKTYEQEIKALEEIIAAKGIADRFPAPSLEAPQKREFVSGR